MSSHDDETPVVEAVAPAPDPAASEVAKPQAQRSTLDERTKNLLIRRFGKEAVESALGVRKPGRPTREADAVRAAARTIDPDAAAEVEDINDEALDQFATRVVLAHLRRTPTKKRALESAIDDAVQRYIGTLGSNNATVASAPAAAPAPAAAAPASRPRFVFL